jgi:transcription antitermination factor NusG
MYEQPSAAKPAKPRWYALHTKPRHERRVETELGRKAIQSFLPMVNEVHRWSDRRKVVEAPLFSCYAFVRITDVSRAKGTILSTPGVFSIVGTRSAATPIPDCEIEALQKLMASGTPMSSTLFLNVGQRVRVRGGALDGVEGVLESRAGGSKLIVSIELIQRSVSVPLSGYDLEPA